MTRAGIKKFLKEMKAHTFWSVVEQHKLLKVHCAQRFDAIWQIFCSYGPLVKQASCSNCEDSHSTTIPQNLLDRGLPDFSTDDRLAESNARKLKLSHHASQIGYLTKT